MVARLRQESAQMAGKDSDARRNKRAIGFLIATGVVLIGLGFGLRAVSTSTTTTTEKTNGRASKVTTTDEPFSETLLVAAIGLGGAFLLCGAFYHRIDTLRFPGGAIELVNAQAEAVSAIQRLIESGEIRLASPEDAAKVAIAAPLLAQRALAMGLPVTASSDLLARWTYPARIPADGKPVPARSQPEELWDRLAKQTLDEVLTKPEA